MAPADDFAVCILFVECAAESMITKSRFDRSHQESYWGMSSRSIRGWGVRSGAVSDLPGPRGSDGVVPIPGHSPWREIGKISTLSDIPFNLRLPVRCLRKLEDNRRVKNCPRKGNDHI